MTLCFGKSTITYQPVYKICKVTSGVACVPNPQHWSTGTQNNVTGTHTGGEDIVHMKKFKKMIHLQVIEWFSSVHVLLLSFKHDHQGQGNRGHGLEALLSLLTFFHKYRGQIICLIIVLSDLTWYSNWTEMFFYRTSLMHIIWCSFTSFIHPYSYDSNTLCVQSRSV